MTDETPCGLRHVQLQAALPDLVPEPGEMSLLTVFWNHDVPLGRRFFSGGELPVPSAALSTIAAACIAPAMRVRIVGQNTEGKVSQPAAAETEGRLPVSVIVCTRNRPDELARCLDSLCRCDPAPAEIVVIDNAPADPATRAVVSARPGLRYVAEARPGLSRARNAGIAAAKGELLAFTDDDVEVTRSWVGALAASFVDPAVGCATGLVLPAELSHPAAFEFEFGYGGLAGSFLPARFDQTLLDQPFGEAPPVWKVGAGANMAVRRVTINATGPFDERLGAGAAGCSEDSEFFHRALAAGWVCAYDPAAVVFHHHRTSMQALRRQMRDYMRGHAMALMVQFGQTRHPGNLVRVFVGLPWHFLKTGLRLSFGPRVPRRAVFPYECLGLLEGPFAWAARARSPKFSDSRKEWSHG